MKKDTIFWVGYSDLLTSLFFVMLILFGATFYNLKKKNEILKVSETQLQEIKKVEKALGSLDRRYFEFDDLNNRFKLNIDVNFRSGSDYITDIPIKEREELYNAGIELYNKLKSLISENPNIEYLMVIEGNAQRSEYGGKWNYIEIPDTGYKLSYKRALSLVNYWKINRGIPFDDIADNCELLIAGSGYFGQSRDKDENKNRRFTIQVTSKIGKFLNKEKK
jgi:hypothetical protein